MTWRRPGVLGPSREAASVNLFVLEEEGVVAGADTRRRLLVGVVRTVRRTIGVRPVAAESEKRTWRLRRGVLASGTASGSDLILTPKLLRRPRRRASGTLSPTASIAHADNAGQHRPGNHHVRYGSGVGIGWDETA
ncbi:hypothetical protein V2G26_018026 [Clonostachys chloroleuca]